MQEDPSLPAANEPSDSGPSPKESAAITDQSKDPPPPARRTREQTAAGSRRLRSGATLAEPGRANFSSMITILAFSVQWESEHDNSVHDSTSKPVSDLARQKAIAIHAGVSRHHCNIH